MNRRGVLLLHGQPGSARDWDRVVGALGARVDAIAIDRPGWDGRRPPTDLAGNATAALEAIDARGVQRTTVVGHSLGAAVAVQLAIERPERVASLVLASPAVNTAALGWFDGLLAAPVAGTLISAAALAGAGLGLGSARVRRRIAGWLDLDDAYLAAASRGLLTPVAWRAFVSEQRMLVRELPRLEPRLTEIAAPTTIVCGSADRVVSLAAVRNLAAQITGAKLEVVAGAGHLLPQKHAARLATIIVDELNAIT